MVQAETHWKFFFAIGVTVVPLFNLALFSCTHHFFSGAKVYLLWNLFLIIHEQEMPF